MTLQIQPPLELLRTLSLHLFPSFCIIRLSFYWITSIGRQICCYLSTLKILLWLHSHQIIECPFTPKHIESVHSGSGSRSVVFRLEVSASQEVVRMQILRNHPRPTYRVRNSGPRNLGFAGSPGYSDNHLGLRTTICALQYVPTLCSLFVPWNSLQSGF